MSGGRRAAGVAWALSVGLVLADSSIVTLALPEILARFDTSVFGVSWVLTSFNLALAAALLPAARAARSRPAATWALGLVAFGLASLACAIAPSIGVLIAGRVVQGLGGAAVVAGAIELLAGARGSHREAAVAWGAAGMAGLALGPAFGGLLTDLLSWEAIFALQVPVLLALPAALSRTRLVHEPGPQPQPDPRPEIALGLISSGLTGALFLLVVLLTEGWRHSPIEAAAVVSMIPLAALVTRGVVGRRLGAAAPAAGTVAVAGGLAALGFLPEAEPLWTLVPQAMIGAGLALSLPALTERALAGRDPEGRRAAGTIAARHAGIVAGLLILTPIFSAELSDQHEAAQRAGTALLLDAPLAPSTKVELGAAIAERIERAGGRLPDLGPAFAAVEPPVEEAAEYAELERQLEAEIDKAATHAFSLAFLAAAALTLLALGALGGGRRRRSEPRLAARERAPGAPLVLGGASLGLAGAYLAMGGATYQPLEVADPCDPRPLEQLAERDSPTEAIVLSALDGVACELRVTREELALALLDATERERFIREHAISDEELEQAARAALLRAVEDAERAGSLSGLEATLIREAVERLPVGAVIDALRSAPGQGAIDLLQDLL